MKKNLLMGLLCSMAFMFSSGPVYAGIATNAKSNAESGSVSSAVTQSGANAVNGGNQNSITFKGANIPPTMPAVSGAQVPVPQLFSSITAPANVAGLPLVQEYLDECQTDATREHPLTNEFAEGASHKTSLVWAPSQDFYTKANRDGRNYWFNGDSTLTQTAGLFRQADSGKRYDCLGIITVEAKAKDPNVIFTTIVSDAQAFTLEGAKFRGFRHIKLFSVKEAMAEALGVRTVGHGFGFLPSVLGVGSDMLTSGQMGMAFNNGTGNTYSAAHLGDTFLVLSPDPKGMKIDPLKFSMAYHPKATTVVIQRNTHQGLVLKRGVTKRAYPKGHVFHYWAPGPVKTKQTVKKVPSDQVHLGK